MDLTPYITITDTGWIDDNARHIMALLNRDGKQIQALFVGGCVRNAIMEKPASDIDIATRHHPDHVRDILGSAGIKTIPTGIQHGTITAVIEGQSYEITTLRRDIQTTGRHAVIAFTEDWREDAARRDFTMNTLLCDVHGNIYDPLGCGIADAQAGRVVFVGDPAQRIREDYLRILRFFRFNAYYSDKAALPDFAALQACAELASHLSVLSKERIGQEFLKIIAAPAPARILHLMRDHAILPDFWLAILDMTALDRLDFLQRTHRRIDIICRLVCLGDVRKDMLATFCAAMRLSNKEIKRYESIIDAYLLLLQDKNIREIIYRHSADIAAQAVLLSTARDNRPFSAVLTALSVCDTWRIPLFPVSGKDMVAAGIAEGQAIGKILHSLEEYWIQNNFAPDRISLLARIKTL